MNRKKRENVQEIIENQLSLYDHIQRMTVEQNTQIGDIVDILRHKKKT